MAQITSINLHPQLEWPALKRLTLALEPGIVDLISHLDFPSAEEAVIIFPEWCHTRSGQKSERAVTPVVTRVKTEVLRVLWRRGVLKRVRVASMKRVRVLSLKRVRVVLMERVRVVSMKRVRVVLMERVRVVLMKRVRVVLRKLALRTQETTVTFQRKICRQ
jgi:hypothetical protein